MKQRIRRLVLETDYTIFTTPQIFAEWLMKLRKQENLLNKPYSESPEEYKNSEDFIKELFWQIVCLQYILLLKQPLTDENLDGIERLIKNYDELDSIETLVPFTFERKNLMVCAWDASKQIGTIVDESNNFVDGGKDTDNFFYLLRHFTGHDVRPELRRFASNLSRDLKQ